MQKQIQNLVKYMMEIFLKAATSCRGKFRILPNI